ncbi:selenium metabolism-associated LysR family transcriptional regulator [Syntrophothermus lipocalidus]|uniref:Transcriptional regulator, LysR family n=1 Tax=Syntrophothermus lipocalidus (strain DSM 12680 / TGB-C1) TaxID=643648 RepID=D7CNN1_SYNLT|nr:selenium metabolism-associated LysR family transcriptional regulator [Syntrophothermus lipocalidus]ADI02316.1 transcriptional regulator, LysR family [Syntrophothermus lipocalidus DSM 12680]
MRIDLFKTFVRVIETQNFTKVARELDISQPAVSKQIQALEEMYGVLLLERTGKKLKPTQAGEALYGCAKDILRAVEKTERVMGDLLETRKGRLLLGASTIPGQYIMPSLMTEFKARFPHVAIYMEVGDSEVIMGKVVDKQLDVGVVGAWAGDRRVDFFKWISDELVLVVPEGHRFLEMDGVTVTDALQEPWVFREKGSGTRMTLEDALQGRGIKREDLNVVAELGSTEAVLASVEAGMGISLVSEWAAKKAENSRKIRALKVKDIDFKRNFYVVFPKQKQRRKSVDLFLDFLRKAEIRPAM